MSSSIDAAPGQCARIAEASETLRQELKKHVRKEIGALAQPDDIRFTGALPKTRSGKILRATMRALADGEDFKTPATIDDPAILPEIEEALHRIGYGD